MLKKIVLGVAFLFCAVSSFAQSDIHKVSFDNFTYYPYCGGEDTQKVTIKDGSYSAAKTIEEFDSRLYFGVFSTIYGDLNNDKKDEAVILTVCNTGGTGRFTEGFIYTIKAGKPTLLARIPGGDRAIGGLLAAKIEKGILIIDQNDPDRNQASCCPEFELTSKYRLIGKKLKKVGKPVSRVIFPAERINFPAGATKTTFKIYLDRIKHYKIRANAGQTLKVSFTSDISPNLSLQMIRGNADVSESGDILTAKLNETGDYVFQIKNTYKFDWEVILTVEIQ